MYRTKSFMPSTEPGSTSEYSKVSAPRLSMSARLQRMKALQRMSHVGLSLTLAKQSLKESMADRPLVCADDRRRPAKALWSNSTSSADC